MSGTHASPAPLRRSHLAGETDDRRVAAVLDVLGGLGIGAAARRHDVAPALLVRWVRGFVEAGSAQVTNRPDPAQAQARDRFLAAFAHELRTPLAVASGWSDLLEEVEDEEDLRATVGQVRSALGLLEQRVQDVELVAAASLGRLRVEPVPVTLAELCAGLGQEARGAPDVEVDARAATTRVLADRRLFPRVLRDAVRALRLDPAPRRLVLEVDGAARGAAEAGPWQELRLRRVADPIEPRVLRALFDPFESNDDATGVSVGLYLARALVVAHGGTIGLDQDDSGATLWVRLPALARGPSSQRSTPTTPQQPRATHTRPRSRTEEAP